MKGRARRRIGHDPTLEPRHATSPIWEDGYSAGEECDAYLAGTYQEWCQRLGLELSPWTYLNRVAHADWRALRGSDLEDAERRASARSWSDVGVMIEDLLLERVHPEDLSRVQREVLIPLELELCNRLISPRQAFARAESAIL